MERAEGHTRRELSWALSVDRIGHMRMHNTYAFPSIVPTRWLVKQRQPG